MFQNKKIIHVSGILFGVGLMFMTLFYSSPGQFKENKMEILESEYKSSHRGNDRNKGLTEYNSSSVSWGSGKLKEVRMCSMEERRQHLLSTCKSVHAVKSVPNLLVDEKHGVLFCLINKVASSAIKRLFTGLRGGKARVMHSEKYLRQCGLKRLFNYPAEKRKHFLKNYTKALLVRHPLDRLRSAYYNKFVQIHYVGHKNYLRALQDIRTNKTDKYRHMRFHEFIQFILRRNKHDSHWTRYDKICHPCAVKYDFIMRMETMDRDMAMFGDEIIKKDISRFLRKTYNKGNYPKNKTVDKHVHEMAAVDNKAYKLLVQAGYEKDMNIFGYSFDKTNNLATCNTKNGCC